MIDKQGLIQVDLGDPSTLERIEDDELGALLGLLLEEQKRRAVEAGDVNALIEEGFAKGFTAKGEAREPWMQAGLLVCPGGRLDKSGTSHTCGFVHIGEDWVWETPDKVYDEVRTIPGPRPQMRSVTVVGAYEGMEVDFITSRTRGGAHERIAAKSFVVKAGTLEAVSVRTSKASSHR